MPHRSLRRYALRALLVAVPALTLAAGWWLALAFVSPTQIEANASPPPPGPVWAPVTSDQLKETVIVSGKVQTESTYAIDLEHVSGRSITAAGTPAGELLVPGALLLEANGRPVFALPGDFPYYRDISRGMEGPDVLQLQHALNSAGANLVVDGVFGSRSAAALKDFYESAGYDAPKAAISAEQEDGGAERSDAEPPTVAARRDVYMPLDEFVTVPPGAYFVQRSPVRGGVVDGEDAIVLTSGGARVAVDEADLVGGTVDVGTVAELEVDGTYLLGSVVAIVEEAKREDGTTTRLYLIAPDSDEAAAALTEIDSRVGVVITLRDLGREHLVVPSDALNFDSQDNATVIKSGGDGERIIVPVSVVASIVGRTAVTVDGSMLEVGDLVMVSE